MTSVSEIRRLDCFEGQEIGEAYTDLHNIVAPINYGVGSCLFVYITSINTNIIKRKPFKPW